MALSFKGSDDDLPEIADINVTPFIDVILVLLIIFMVAAPLSTVDVAVDLPISNAAQQQRPEKPIFLSLKADLTLALGNKTVAPDTLGEALDALTGKDREQRIFVRADQSVPYRDIMSIMNRLRSAGYLKIGLVGLEDAGATAQNTP